MSKRNSLESPLLSSRFAVNEARRFFWRQRARRQRAAGAAAEMQSLEPRLCLSTIAGLAWTDMNGNGLVDAGEPGMSGVTVNLLDGGGVQQDTTTTGSNGQYSFTAGAGTFEIEVVAPDGFQFTTPNVGGNPAVNSAVDDTTGITAAFTLTAVQTATENAGMFELANVGDFVWDDLNNNGLQDAGEPGLANVTVNLLDGTSAVVNTTTTDDNGNYSLDAAPGTYQIEFVSPGGYVPTLQNVGSDPTINSKADPNTGLTAQFALTSGQQDLDQDAGMVQLASVGDLVWEDLNGDGIQDAGEPGLADVTVNLLDNTSAVVNTTTTDSNGNYFFDTAPGTYQVEFILPSGYFFSPQGTGSDPTVDSDADPATGLTASFTLVSGDQNLDEDAGMGQLVSVGDFVWDDLNHDGIQDAGEPGIANVPVTLLDSFGNWVNDTTTDDGGFYSFDTVPGTYSIAFTPPAQYWFTSQLQGADPTLNSKVNPASGQIDTVALTSGQVDLDEDAGMYYQPLSVTDVSDEVNQNAKLTFDPTDFSDAFSDPATGEPLDRIQILSLPGNGKLRLDGVPVAVNQEIAADQLGELTYTPYTGFDGEDSFSWNGADSRGYAVDPASADLTVIDVNPPVVTNVSKSLNMNTPRTFGSSDFLGAFSDPDLGDRLVKIEITSLPTQGTLTLGGESVAASDEIALWQVSGLTYTPNTGYTGADSFGWNGSDGAAYANNAATVNLTVNTTYVDLAGVLGTSWTLPSSAVAGKKLTGNVSVVVSNLGNTALPSGQQVNIEFRARDLTNTAAPDVVLKTLTNQSVSALAAHGTRTFTTSVNLPTGLPADSYQVVAYITPVQTLVESWTANNLADQTLQGDAKTITSTAAFMDIASTFGTTWTLPGAVVNNRPLTGNVSAIVKNQGNVALPSGQQVTIQFIARDTTTPANPDVVLKTLTNQSVSSLAAGASRTFTTSVNLPGGLNPDTYQVLATVTPVQALTESSTANNTATTPAHGIISAAIFFDLSATFGTTWTLPATAVVGKALSGNVSVAVQNRSNAPMPAVQQVNIQFIASDTTDPGNPDIVLKTLTNQSVSSLAVGATRTFVTSVSLPAGLPEDSYEISAVVTPVQALTETDTANNTATTPAHTVDSVEAFNDLAATFGTTWTLPTAVVAGRTFSGNVSAAVKNQGNVALPAGQQVNIQFLASDTTNPANPDIVLKTLSNQSVSSLAVGATRTFVTSVSLPAGLPADSYEISAVVTPVQALTESNTANDTATTPSHAILSATGFFDLGGVLGTNWTLPSDYTAGWSLSGNVSAVVQNLGNLALPAGQQVSIQFVARDLVTPSNPDILLKTLTNQSVSGLAAGSSRTFTTSISLPGGLPEGDFQFAAIIAPVQPLTEASTANNTALTNAVGDTLTITLT